LAFSSGTWYTINIFLANDIVDSTVLIDLDLRDLRLSRSVDVFTWIARLWEDRSGRSIITLQIAVAAFKYNVTISDSPRRLQSLVPPTELITSRRWLIAIPFHCSQNMAKVSSAIQDESLSFSR
jgi:hypothetical protein